MTFIQLNSFGKATYHVYNFDNNFNLKNKKEFIDTYDCDFTFDEQGFTCNYNLIDKNGKNIIERFNTKFEKQWEFNSNKDVKTYTKSELVFQNENTILLSETTTEKPNSKEGTINLRGINKLNGKTIFTSQLNEVDKIVNHPVVFHNLEKKEYTLVGQYFADYKTLCNKKPIGNYIYKVDYDGKIISKKFTEFNIDFASISAIYKNKKFESVINFNYEQLSNGNIIFYGEIKLSDYNYLYVAEYNSDYKIIKINTIKREQYYSSNLNGFLNVFVRAINELNPIQKQSASNFVYFNSNENDYTIIIFSHNKTPWLSSNFQHSQINLFESKKSLISTHEVKINNKEDEFYDKRLFLLTTNNQDQYILLKTFKLDFVYETHNTNEDFEYILEFKSLKK